MDTSTISFSEDISPPSPRTQSITRDKAEPGPVHTRAIPPTTMPEVESSDNGPSSSGSPSSQRYPASGPRRQLPVLDYEVFKSPSGYGYGGQAEVVDVKGVAPHPPRHTIDEPDDEPSAILIVFIPLLVVILTVLLGVLIFLIALVCMRRQKGIRLTEDGGPLDLSKSDGVIGEGGVEGVEARWLETVNDDVSEAYRRAKDWQGQYQPTSVPTDITLSQFLSIQEKGVSAWAFEPDYEENLSLFVQSRTEVTFLADGPGMPAREGGGNSVMANLPLPKLNEVYYWEVKLYDKPAQTEVAIGLATKPYPTFRLPGWNRYSVAYFASDGFKSHNYPFTASSYGPPLAEGDVLGVGYRPRAGTVFFTRNGRKLEDCYTGLNKLNLFPTVGANGPCTLHINFGQAGFVFIEANVKKWGLAPMTGTLAPPPPYGSERGSILLESGYGTPGANRPQPHPHGINALIEAARARAANQLGPNRAGVPVPNAGPSNVPQTPRSSRRHRKRSSVSSVVPQVPSPLRTEQGSAESSTRPRLAEVSDEVSVTSYVSPTDTPRVAPRVPSVEELDDVNSDSEEEIDEEADESFSSVSVASSSQAPNPPTPNHLDISLHSIRRQNYFPDQLDARQNDTTRSPSGTSSANSAAGSGETVRASQPQYSPTLGPPTDSPPPPGYAPLDPNVYSQGLPVDLPEDLVAQAIAALDNPGTNASQTHAETRSDEHHPHGGPLGWIRDHFGSGSSGSNV